MTLISLLILGFVLSLDNARLAVALGAFKLSWRRALRIALVFG
jgi:putative Mn2+ efflux pump MntP